MKNLKDKILELEVKAITGVRSFLKDEKGDTNFISIAIILIVVIGVATVFISFGDTIKAKFTEKVAELTGALG